MKLYYSKGACSLSDRIVIHELGLTCHYESVDLKTKTTEKGADFLKINPKGSVPTLITDKNEILTENIAIQLYLSDVSKKDLLLPVKTDFKHYKAIEWLSFIGSDVHKSCGPFFNSEIPQELKDTIFLPQLKNKLKFVDDHLKSKKYLLGDIFSLPDAYLFVVLRWLKSFKIDIKEWPNLNRYFLEVEKRPAVQEALNDEGLKAS